MSKNINHFKFSKNFIEQIKIFCENNRQCDNFKKIYEIWKIENIIIINKEKNILLLSGYSGNFESKLDKSILYYFKYNCSSLNDNKDKNIITRQYFSFDFEFLQLIDTHIERHFKSEYKIKGEILFDDFKLLYNNEIADQKNKLKDLFNDKNKLDIKVKKTYQNRYYNINKKL